MLQTQIEALFDAPPASYREEHFELFKSFKNALNRGEIRAAEPDPASLAGWRVNPWVKKGILLGFRMGAIVDMSLDARRQPFFDKSTYPVRGITLSDGVRIVPGGSSIRDGSYIGRGVICMPPMFVNAGAYVGENTMIDSHALVGSCAQIGRNCHLSAAAQIGGVLEPVGGLPVIIEDDVMIGGNAGVYEGTVVKRGVVLGTGTVLNRSIPVYDLVRDAVYSAKDVQPLVIPQDAVVVPGSRDVTHPVGAKYGLSLQAAVIVKYRDAKTDARVLLEDLLR
ncbi:MAG TPA: 2,3,4,5-tetrahydropyridine-2,6-dicarboxylate N-succinyltransferase [Candidatus Limnocylindrales bacterium]|nr:2,3,4,5-tetrahydropyridine-2,6-dicarboxylate N-succinyltransferase [Candidatus Limnocylindrales bacterium]